MIQYWFNPDSDQLGQQAEDFLQKLQRPTLIHIPGLDRSRKRAICTLLHGNEPSGTRALHRWLLTRDRLPAVDILCFFGAVETALEAPGFHYRQLPGQPDLNRCFKPPFDTRQGRLAQSILELLQAMQPESLIDIHNTSGKGPAFAVTMTVDTAHKALTSLFTNRLLVTKLRLGALFEYSERNVPTITVECGGANDSSSDEMAFAGLSRYVNEPQILEYSAKDSPLEILHEPVRLELDTGGRVSYQERPDITADITLMPDIERHNFSAVQPTEQLGWVHPDRWQYLKMITPEGKNIIDQMFTLEQNRLYPAQPLKLFMITSNPIIAQSDCLFYAVADNHSHLQQN